MKTLRLTSVFTFPYKNKSRTGGAFLLLFVSSSLESGETTNFSILPSQLSLALQKDILLHFPKNFNKKLSQINRLDPE